MAAHTRLTDEQRQEILALHAEGFGRNEIMRRLKLSAGSVTGTVQAAGMSFERVDMTAVAVEARRRDLQARRAALIIGLLEDAALLRAQLFSPTKAFNFGGKDNTYAEVQLDEPTFRDKRDIMSAITAALNSAARMEELDRESGAGEQRSTLADLMGTLKRAWEQAHPTDDEPLQ